MIPRLALPADVLALAQRQAGVISREQLVGSGVSDRVIQRLLREGRFERVCHGIYSTAAGGWLQQAWAGVLIGGPTAVLGGAAAGYLNGLVREPPAQVVVYSSNWRGRDERWRLVRSQRTGSGEPPRTRPAQTVVDLSAELGADAIVALVAEAVGRRGVRPQELLAALATTTRHPHRRLLEELVGEVAAGSRSPLEWRYARDVERAHGLPRAVRQQSPLPQYRGDAWYRAYGVLVELDGRAFHSGAAVYADMDRDNDHRLLGLVTLRFGWRQVTSTPCQVATTVAAALRHGGWTGSPTGCPRCRAPL